MPIQKHLSLRKAARIAGIDSKTLKRWMERELGYCFPKVRHGSCILVLERDVELVLERHRSAQAAFKRS
jgi:predicted site-specific integrase-resolvase